MENSALVGFYVVVPLTVQVYAFFINFPNFAKHQIWIEGSGHIYLWWPEARMNRPHEMTWDYTCIIGLARSLQNCPLDAVSRRAPLKGFK